MPFTKKAQDKKRNRRAKSPKSFCRNKTKVKTTVKATLKRLKILKILYTSRPLIHFACRLRLLRKIVDTHYYFKKTKTETAKLAPEAEHPYNAH